MATTNFTFAQCQAGIFGQHGINTNGANTMSPSSTLQASVWSGWIRGTDATLTCLECFGNEPFNVCVDGVATTPGFAGSATSGALPILSGESDVWHFLNVAVKAGFNGDATLSTVSGATYLSVTGSSPAIENFADNALCYLVQDPAAPLEVLSLDYPPWAAPWQPLISYPFGATITNGGTCYAQQFSGGFAMSAASGGPSGAGPNIADGTCLWSVQSNQFPNGLTNFSASSTAGINIGYYYDSDTLSPNSQSFQVRGQGVELWAYGPLGATVSDAEPGGTINQTLCWLNVDGGPMAPALTTQGSPTLTPGGIAPGIAPASNFSCWYVLAQGLDASKPHTYKIYNWSMVNPPNPIVGLAFRNPGAGPGSFATVPYVPKVAEFGDSTTYGLCPISTACFNTQNLPILQTNLGVSGQTTAQIGARIVNQVAAWAGRGVHFDRLILNAGRNDSANSQYQTDFAAALGQCLLTPVPLIVTMPVGVTTGSAVLAQGAFQGAAVASVASPRVYWIDPNWGANPATYTTPVNPLPPAWAAVMGSLDGVHPNVPGYQYKSALVQRDGFGVIVGWAAFGFAF